MKSNKLLASFAIALAVLFTGCQKDDYNEIPGICPVVVETNPANLGTFVSLNKIITATFNVNMEPVNFTPESFILQDQNKSTSAVNQGVLSYDVATKTISFEPSSPLANNTTYKATIRSTVKDLNGIGLQGDYIWTFSTGPSVTPLVTITNPPNAASNVSIGKTITATLNVPMNATSLNETTFTLYNGATQVAGTVSYAGYKASFNPDADLLPGVLYTATITTGAQSVTGTALGSDFVWTFSTLASGIPYVMSEDPVDLAINVPLDKVISVDFNEAMNGLTITTASFTLMNGVTPVSGTVNYSGTTANFTPDVDLLSGITYTATITTGAENLSGVATANDYVWKFSTGASVSVGPGIVNLGTSGNFAVLAKSGISTTGVTSITGDIGVSPATSTAISGFGLIMDASNTYAITSMVTGKVYASNYSAPTPAYITTAISDMENALTTAMGMTLSVINELGAGDISGMTLTSGLYKWGTGLLITGAGVTLTGGPNDTWVFQVSDDFTVNGDIVLSGGAQAKNIYWVTETQALLAGNINFSGNIIAKTLISLNAGTHVNGRLLSQTAVTLNAATIVKP